MTLPLRRFVLSTIALAGLLGSGALFAQEASIRKALAERIPNLPKIDEVKPSPIAGVFEVRFGGT